MRKISINKVVSWFLIFTMMIVLKPISVEGTTASSKLIFKNYKVISSGAIFKGSVFKVEITIENTSNDDASNVAIQIQPCSFSPNESGNVILVGNIARGKTLTKTVELKYNGELDADVYFNINSDLGVSEEFYISIDNTYPEGINNGSGTNADTRKYAPKLKIDNVDSLSIQAGTTSTLNFKLKNIGNYTAKDVMVNAVIDEPFESGSITTSRSVGEIPNRRDKGFNYTLKVKGLAEPKTYPITLKYTFTNAYGDVFESSEIIYIKVIKSSINVELGIDNVATAPANIKAGDNFTLSLDIKNDEKVNVKNVSVALVGLTSDGFVLSSGRNLQVIPSIEGSSKKTVTFNLNADPKMKSGNQVLKAKLVYIGGNGDEKTDEQDIYLKVNAGDTSNLSIENMVYPTNQLVPGETFTVAFDVANLGDGVAEHITVTADGGENIISKSQSTQLISKLASNSSKTVYFKFQPQDKLVAKSYLINIEIKNGKNEVVQSMKQYVGVEVGQKSDIIIGAVAQSTYVIKPSEGFNVSFPITNRGVGTTKNIKVSINGGDAILTTSGSTQLIPSLGAGKTQYVTFNLQASKGAETKNYPIGIEVKYDGLGENTIKDNTSIYVEKNAGANEKGVPRIIINKYSVDPVIVKAGSNFELELSFLNTNFAKEVKNIKVYLTVDEKSSKTGNVFTPVNSSNTFFIDAISPKQIANKKITLYTIPDASAKTYTITANLEYEDVNGTEYKAQELIGIAVSQPSKLKIGDIQMSSEVFVGQPTSISAEFYNVGKVALSNFMVRAEGNFTIQKANYFVGNFDIGGSDTYEVEITPNALGDLKGFVIFSYDEPNGEHVEIKKAITAQVTEMPPVEANPGDMVPLEGNKSSKWIKIIAAVVLLGAAVVGRIVYKKRKEKKEEAGLSADE
jgi:hypothetical protein